MFSAGNHSSRGRHFPSSTSSTGRTTRPCQPSGVSRHSSNSAGTLSRLVRRPILETLVQTDVFDPLLGGSTDALHVLKKPLGLVLGREGDTSESSADMRSEIAGRA